MFRFLLSAASIFVLLTVTMFPPGVAAARRCGERLPVTLLSLYRSSEFIYIGKYDKLEEGGSTEDTEDYRVIPIKKHFSISSALKGESRKMLTLEETEYRYKARETAAEAPVATPEGSTVATVASEDAVAPEAQPEDESGTAEEVEDTGEDSSEDAEGNAPRPGDSVLLFLNKNADAGEDALVLSDDVDGIKKMTPEKLSAYEARIMELNAIFSGKKPSHSRIVAWLVRCAEDPSTRWEGTYELLRSFQNKDWQEERAKEVAEKPAPPDESEASDHEEPDPEQAKEFDTGDPNFAKALSEAEKLSLTNILLERERPVRSGNSEDDSMTRGDRELIELVKRWGDSKVAVNLIGQLRNDSSDTNFNSDLMASIASILDDDVLSEISVRYMDVQWMDGDAAIDEDAAEEAVATNPKPIWLNGELVEPAREPAAAATSEVIIGEADAQTPPASKESKPKKKTYAELRSDLMKEFLARADKVIAKQENTETH